MSLRYRALIELRNQIRSVRLDTESGAQYLLAENTYFDPTTAPELPKFTVAPAPHSIIVDNQGTGRQNTMQITIIGFAKRLRLVKPSFATVEDHNKLNGTLFYTIEIVLDAILSHLVDPAVVAVMADCAAGLGFSITEFGPIVVDEYEEESEIGYLSLNPTIIFVEN